MIAWDPPGWGYSRPPERNLEDGLFVFHEDADIGAALMEKLGYEKYCVLGWSFGGRVGLLLAIKYASRVQKLVVWAAASHSDRGENLLMSYIADTSTWAQDHVEPYEKVYGKQQFAMMWDKQAAFIRSLPTNLCRDEIGDIMCPTLIMQGDKDPMTPHYLAQYLADNINDARMYRFAEGGHSVHIQYADEFNREVTEFLKK